MVRGDELFRLLREALAQLRWDMVRYLADADARLLKILLGRFLVLLLRGNLAEQYVQAPQSAQQPVIFAGMAGVLEQVKPSGQAWPRIAIAFNLRSSDRAR